MTENKQEPKYTDSQMNAVGFFGMAIGFALCLVLVSIYGAYKETDKPRESVLTFTNGTNEVVTIAAEILEGDTDSAEVDKATMDALEAATDAWEEALGIKLKTPKILYKSAETSTCHTPIATACAGFGGDLITIHTMKSDRMKSILMHEIGHLLDVHHIEEDALMRPYNIERVDRPTDDAVAIAKQHHIWDKPGFKLKP